MRHYRAKHQPASVPVQSSANRFTPSPVIQTKAEATELPEWQQANNYDLDILNLNSTPIQAKLTIGEPNDKYEQEADRVAAEVVQRMNEPESVQRETAPEEEEKMQAKRETAPEEEEKMQAKPQLQRQGVSGAVSPELEQSLNRAKAGGQSLDPQIQAKMGQAMGADFSGVKVHTDSQADQLNQAIQAKAFTTGKDVFFRQGEYNPGSSSGQELIAHELTHVVQQGATPHTAVRTTPTTEHIQRVSVNSTKASDWDTLTNGKTGAGVNGVIFATAADGSSVVVKGLSEPPQRVMLAQELMEQAGVATTETKPIAAQSKLGRHILNKLDELGVTVADNNIQAKVANWRGYQTLLLMAPANVKSLQELFTQGPGLGAPNNGAPLIGGPRAVRQADINQHTLYFQNLFNNAQMWKDFGKIFFIDQFLGNEDRFETLKIQNVFIDDQGQVMALDNDTMAADYISQVTSVDAVTNPRQAPQQQIVNLTPDNYIQNVIAGGWMHNNTALQERMMGSLNQVSGRSGELGTKVNQKVNALLNSLLNAVQNGQSNSDVAATAVITNILNNVQPCQFNMTQGAIFAQQMIQNMFRKQVSKKKNQFQVLFEAQSKQYKKGYQPKTETMYNYLSLAIRYEYLELRSGGQDHQTALGNVQALFRQQVADMARTAVTELEMDQNTYVTSERLVSIT
ncbi:DUF4157 domain-containing protein [Spirulina sp. CCNP1310]|uniref:eCIS core domain-containing protein n=1 Tax=Spirulina sp. CCNP1310 TaxID=3110249 RepID=UPI002B1ECE98|nr:DUF4157 domain-containing protein [Spirulina sp. CCNP1310]MEA5418552.1 DUF4157 domain-containing protein [Spirulina sp. CCNP1310]